MSSTSDFAISVVIPAYNRERYLGAAVESVLAQTRAPSEIIVVDDGSTDGTGDVARGFEQVVCIRQQNQGTGAARNAGVKAAGGHVIAFLDSDDIWLPRKLELQAEHLRAHPEVDMVFCHMRQFLSPELDPEQAPKFNDKAIPAANAGALMVRREAFLQAGFFPAERNVPEFFPWSARALDAGLKQYTLPDVLLHRRVHLTNMVNDPQFKLEYVRFLKQRLDQQRIAGRRAG